jgi:hypothetical protein
MTVDVAGQDERVGDRQDREICTVSSASARTVSRPRHSCARPSTIRAVEEEAGVVYDAEKWRRSSSSSAGSMETVDDRKVVVSVRCVPNG